MDYTTLITEYNSSTALKLTTPADEAFTTFTTGTATTNLVTTNALSGDLTFTGFKGNDGITWVADTAYNFTTPCTNAAIVYSTNYTSLPAFGYLKWTIQNPPANGCSVETITISTGSR